jgi:hypothetical protein
MTTLSATIYAHVGDWVQKGQPIAISGNSGPPGTGYHTHFRISFGAQSAFDYTNGVPIKPEPMSGTGPPGYVNWQLYGCSDSGRYDSATTFKSTSPYQAVAVAPRPSPTPGATEDLDIRGSTNDSWHAPTYSNGQPTVWESLGTGVVIKGQPSAVWDSGGNRLDVFAIWWTGYVFHDAWVNPTGWTGWSDVGIPQTAGQSETEGINVTRRPIDNTIDIFFRGPGPDPVHQTAWHAQTDSSGHAMNWEQIPGGLVKGAPSGRWDSGTSRLDVFAIGVSDDLVWHTIKLYGCGCWSSWSALNVNKTSGMAETETVSAVRRSDNTMDLFIRGVDRAAWWAHTDSAGNVLAPNWLSAGGLVRGAAEAKWDQSGGRMDVFVVGLDDQIYIRTWTGNWTADWTVLNLGGRTG